MSARSDLVEDTAIAVIATQGMRGLTHRAVDALADLPIGSASNIHRTRDALIDGASARLGALLRADIAHVRDRRLDQATTYRLLTGPRQDAVRALITLALDPSIPRTSRAIVTTISHELLELVRHQGLGSTIVDHLVGPRPEKKD